MQGGGGVVCVEGVHVGVQHMCVSVGIMGEDTCVGHESNIEVEVENHQLRASASAMR
jgi:hypothetical protein